MGDVVDMGRETVEQLHARQFDKVAASFDAAVSQHFNATALEQLWDQVLAKAGAYEETLGFDILDSPPNIDAVVVMCRFEKGRLLIRLAYDKDAKIAGFGLIPG